MKREIRVRCLLPLILVLPGICAGQGHWRDRTSAWQQQVLDHRDDVFAVMFTYHKPEAARRSQTFTDVVLWRILPRLGLARDKDTVREYEEGLEKVLKDHSDSPFADEAALILARAKFYWHDDVEGAIESLQKVANDYPNGAWIAENREWIHQVNNVFISLRKGRSVVRDVCASTPSAVLDYIAIEKPNSTVDEAYMTIGDFYAKGYAKPAERQVECYQKILDRHTGTNRFAEDLAFVERVESKKSAGYLLSWMRFRHEDRALLNLVEYYRGTGEFQKAVVYGKRFIEKMDSHALACFRAGIYPKMAEMEDALGHRDAASIYREMGIEAKRVWQDWQDRIR